MATKEEHYEKIRRVQQAQDYMDALRKIQDEQQRHAEALAERDAAREENKVLNDFANKLMAIVKPNDERMMSLNGALNAVMALKEREAELAKLKAAQPAAESAPVVGGVTEAMLDELCEALDIPSKRARGLMLRIRAAIRATKRVDVEAIREVAANCYADTKEKLLRAIGDAPAAEAPVVELKLEKPYGDETVYPSAPSPEPAAPAHDRRTFTRQGCYIRSNGFDWLRLVDGSSAANADEALRLLNVGLEAEKLRARVVELERDRDGWKLDAQLRARNEGVQKARADAAEKDRDAAWEQARYTNEALNVETEKRKDAEAKLAALGENPIRRGLVERHEAELSRSILAGRGPEVAS